MCRFVIRTKTSRKIRLLVQSPPTGRGEEQDGRDKPGHDVVESQNGVRLRIAAVSVPSSR